MRESAGSTSASRGRGTSASGHANSNNGSGQSMLDTFLGSRSTTTPAQSTRTPCQILRSCAEDSPANHSRRPASEKDWPTPEVMYALRSLGLLKPDSHNICFSKTSPAYCLTPKGKRLPASYPRWMKWGMMSHGRSLTGQISWRSNASVSSLSDVLETVVPAKYYLSKQAKERLVRMDREKRKRRAGGAAGALCRL